MDTNIQILGKLMDVCEIRHKVLADNLANSNTPNFIRKDVRFQDTLRKAIQSGDATQIGDVTPEIFQDRSRKADANGNNVMAQDELSSITENSLLFGAAAKIVSGKFATLRKAIGSK